MLASLFAPQSAAGDKTRKPAAIDLLDQSQKSFAQLQSDIEMSANSGPSSTNDDASKSSSSGGFKHAYAAYGVDTTESKAAA